MHYRSNFIDRFVKCRALNKNLHPVINLTIRRTTNYSHEAHEGDINGAHNGNEFYGEVYADEPLAEEEWIQNYEGGENERIEAEIKFRRRFDGSDNISEW